MAKVLVGRRLVVAFAASGGLLLAALALDSTALAVLGILLTCLATVGPALPRRVPLRGTVSIATPHAVEEETLHVEVALENLRRTNLGVEVRVDLPDVASVVEGSESGTVWLKGRSTLPLTFQTKVHLFGLQRLGPVVARLGDPFGFTAVEEPVGAPHDIRVFPRRESLRDPVLRAKQMRAVLGRFEVSRPGHGFEFFGLRDYAVGDRPRDVNWKASARTGSLIVNQRQKESDAEVVLLVDARAAGVVGRQTLSPYAQGCRAALAVAEAHLKGRDAVRFVAYGRDLVEDRHTGAVRHMRGILDLVVGLRPGGDMPLMDVVQRILPGLKRKSPVMIFTSAMGDPSLPDALRLLRSHEFPVSVFVARPTWSATGPDLASLAWEARQKVEVRTMRRAGVPVAYHGADGLLAVSLDGMEVRV